MLPSHKWLGYFRLSLRDKEADVAALYSINTSVTVYAGHR
jgi:hypothetical protein